MNKKILYAMLLTISVIAYGQNNKVGINTKTPKQTLDIDGNEGTLRIDSPGSSQGKSDVLPLAWIPNGNNQGKIVKGATADYKPFRIVDYEFIMKKNQDQINGYSGDNGSGGTQHGGKYFIEQDLIDGVDLEIPTNKYTVIALTHALLDTKGDAVYMRSLISDGTYRYDQHGDKGTDPILLGNNQDNGHGNVFYNVGHSDWGSARIRVNGRYMATSSPLVFTYKGKDGKWKFHADYPRTTPISFNYTENSGDVKIVPIEEKENAYYDFTRDYKWVVTFLIIDNSFIKPLPQIEINLKNGIGVSPTPIK